MSLPPVLYGALVVYLALLGLAHDSLELLLELGVPARPAVDSRRGVLQSLALPLGQITNVQTDPRSMEFSLKFFW